jgi:hypothetical protein
MKVKISNDIVTLETDQIPPNSVAGEMSNV